MTGFPFLYFMCLIFTVFWDGTWATWTGTLWYGRSSCGRWRIWSRLHSDSAVSVRIQGLRISERRGGWHRKLDGLSILGAFLGVPQNILRHVIFVAWFLWFNNIQHRSQSSKLWPEPGCESHRNVAKARQKQTGMQAECTWRHRALTQHKTYSYNSKPRPRLNWLAAKPYKWWLQNKAWNSPILNYPDPFLQMMSKSWTFRKFKTSDVSHQLDHLEPASLDQLKLCLSIVSFSSPKMESSHSPNHLHIFCRLYIYI